MFISAWCGIIHMFRRFPPYCIRVKAQHINISPITAL